MDLVYYDLAMICTGCPVPVEYPGVSAEGLRGIGSFERSGPCGFYDEDTDKFYLGRRTTTTLTTRAIDPAPPTYACTLVGGIGGSSDRRSTTGSATHDVDYDHIVAELFTPTDTGGCSTTDSDVTTSSYTLTYQVDTIYATSDTTCSRTAGGTIETATTEVDPDSMTPDVEYSSPWEPLDGDSIKAGADAAMEAAFAEAEWTEGAVTVRAELSSDEDGLRIAEHSKASTRFHVIGGNTGYIAWDWIVYDDEGTIVQSGTEEYTWTPDPDVPVDHTIDGPALEIAYPPTPGLSDSASVFYSLAIVAIRYDP